MIRRLVAAISRLFRRPRALQVAALCYRTGPDGPEVLLVKRRGRGRWILPKGWPIAGKTLAEAAGTEAWEEAGVRGRLNPVAIGTYHYEKKQGGGIRQPCSAEVFEIEVETFADDFPESSERKRLWLPAMEAAHKVKAPELKAILRSFAEQRQNSAL